MAATSRNDLVRSLRTTWHIAEFVAVYGVLPAVLWALSSGRWSQAMVWCVLAVAMAVLCHLTKVPPSRIGLGSSARSHTLACLLTGLVLMAIVLTAWSVGRAAMGRSPFAPPAYPAAAWLVWGALTLAGAVVHEFVFRAVLLSRYAPVLPAGSVVHVSALASTWAYLAANRWEVALAWGLGGWICAFAYRRHPSLPAAVTLHLLYFTLATLIGFAAPPYRP